MMLSSRQGRTVVQGRIDRGHLDQLAALATARIAMVSAVNLTRRPSVAIECGFRESNL
jgi:hypothetical protein